MSGTEARIWLILGLAWVLNLAWEYTTYRYALFACRRAERKLRKVRRELGLDD